MGGMLFDIVVSEKGCAGGGFGRGLGAMFCGPVACRVSGICAVGLACACLGGIWGKGVRGWWREEAREVTGS